MTPRRTGFAYLDAHLDRPGAVLAFAHRGGAYHPELEGLENTVAAFRHAADLGYRYLETDVHATRDGVLLAFHDTVLDRVTDLRGEIATLTQEEVGEALIGGRERVPTLAQLFEEFPEARFNIDIKAAPAIPLLAAFLEEREAWDRVLVASFSPGRLRAFRDLTDGRVATSAHPWELVAFRFLPSGRLARRLTGGRPSALQVPHQRRGFRDRHPGADPARPPGRAARARVDGGRPRRDERAARSWCRRADDRPHRHTQGCAGRARPVVVASGVILRRADS